jgi:hypothetical protein
MKSRMRSALILRLLTGCIGITVCLSLPATAGGELSRQLTTPTGRYDRAEVNYDWNHYSTGDRVREIVTRLCSLSADHAVIFEAGWLSRDSVEVPSRSDETSGKVFRVEAGLSGIVTVQMDFQFDERCPIQMHLRVFGPPENSRRIERPQEGS